MSKDKRSSKKKKRVFTQSRKEERNSINVRKKRKPKCASSLKNLKFIMPRREEGSSKRKFIKKGKDSSSTERCKCIEARKKSRECIKMAENH